MINQWIGELLRYALSCGLIEKEDLTFHTNQLLDLFSLSSYEPTELPAESRPLHEILSDLCSYAVWEGILPDDSVGTRDLFDTKIMGLLTPLPSKVIRTFEQLRKENGASATDYFYKLSQDNNYIRRDRIAKDEKWVYESEYGPIDITINLSKPEKDPRDIVKAASAPKSGYPACLLCRENEGYAGHVSHPARQNLRLIPMVLGGEEFFMQYSPYVYYNEHCIVLSKVHAPMKIDRSTFEKLLDFTTLLPHYMLGSNAGLPIVGGSILSHEHFQGGRYEFAMTKAPYEQEFSLSAFPDIRFGTVRWPMSVIRLQGSDSSRIAEAADYILHVWKDYNDPSVMILSETNGEPHNTITPIARRRGSLYELDLVLRNNLTTQDRPMGLYHPRPEYHHIKRENIGLIEVMGLAVLPSRLKAEMKELEQAILHGDNLRENERLAPHADWAEAWRRDCGVLTEKNIHEIVQKEIGKVFVKVLEDAGVFKRDEAGQAAFARFIATL